MKIRSNVLPLALLLLLPLLVIGGCKRPGAAPDTAAPGPRVENRALGLVLGELPAPFTVETNAGETLALGAPEDGHVTFEVAVRPTGVDVTAEAQAAQSEIAALPGGRFEGGTKLVTPFGEAYTVRGTFDDGGRRIEERRVYMPHPAGGARLVTIRYRYPAGDTAASRERLEQTLALIGAVEAGEGSASP